MCLLVPRRVLGAVDGSLEVEWDGGAVRSVARGTIEDVSAGDYVLVYAGMAIERVDAEEAAQHLRFLADLDRGILDTGEAPS